MYFIQLVQSSAKKSNQNTLPDVTCLSHCMYICTVMYRTIFYQITCTQSGFLVFEKECSVKQNCFLLRFDFFTAIIFIVSTFQSKSLQNDASVLFSPPSIIKDTLPEEILEEMKSPPKQKNKVCCKTDPPPKIKKGNNNKTSSKAKPFNMHIKINVFSPL